MDQLKEVRDRIAARIAEKKSMPLAEQIRYEHYLDCLYKMSIQHLETQKIDDMCLAYMFSKHNVSAHQDYFGLCRRNAGYVPPLLSSLYSVFIDLRTRFYNSLLCDDITIVFYIYDQFNEVLK